MPRRSSLGPFPKTHRWSEIVTRAGGSIAEADRLIGELRFSLARLADDPQARAFVRYFVALPVMSRRPEQRRALGIHFSGNWLESLEAHVPTEGPVRRAAIKTLCRLMNSARMAQQDTLGESAEERFRQLDGSAFCDVGRLLFACLTAEQIEGLLENAGLRVDERVIERHAWELSLITRSFTARWFNACVVGKLPALGSIDWYLRHCLGKIDMELERELSTHVEPVYFGSRRRKEPPSLGLGI